MNKVDKELLNLLNRVGKEVLRVPDKGVKITYEVRLSTYTTMNTEVALYMYRWDDTNNRILANTSILVTKENLNKTIKAVKEWK